MSLKDDTNLSYLVLVLPKTLTLYWPSALRNQINQPCATSNLSPIICNFAAFDVHYKDKTYRFLST